MASVTRTLIEILESVGRPRTTLLDRNSSWAATLLAVVLLNVPSTPPMVRTVVTVVAGSVELV